MTWYRSILIVLLALLNGGAQADISSWTQSIVVVESNIVEHSFYEPWSSTSRTVKKNAIVLSEQRILTTADWLQNSTHVRVQRGGRGRWWNAHIKWVDYHANLALIGTDDENFWQGLVPITFSKEVPQRGNVQIFKLSGGNLESWQAAISKVFVTSTQRSFMRHMMLELTSDVDSSGWSEVLVKNGEVLGLAASQDADRLLAIPAPLIVDILAAKAADPKSALGYFDFVWQFTRNPAVTQFLGLEGPARGVIVTKVAPTSAFAGVLQPRDIILEIDGFTIDSDGDYDDPVYGHLSFRNLATRNHFAGEHIDLLVWRDGMTVKLNAELPEARYDNELVPDQNFDEAPEYLIAGGLIFQPLTTSYLRSWGKEWWKAAPFRLIYYTHESPTIERPQLVILSHVLPDRFNLGYQDLSYMVVDEVNGHPISDLQELKNAFQSSTDGFHVVEFAANSTIHKLVLDASNLAHATRRIIDNYGITRVDVIR